MRSVNRVFIYFYKLIKPDGSAEDEMVLCHQQSRDLDTVTELESITIGVFVAHPFLEPGTEFPRVGRDNSS